MTFSNKNKTVACNNMHFIYIVVFHSFTHIRHVQSRAYLTFIHTLIHIHTYTHTHTHSYTYILIHIHTYTHTTKPNNTRAVLKKYIIKKLEQLREETNDHTLRIMSVTWVELTSLISSLSSMWYLQKLKHQQGLILLQVLFKVKITKWAVSWVCWY